VYRFNQKREIELKSMKNVPLGRFEASMQHALYKLEWKIKKIKKDLGILIID
jgi:hypothetical protein